MKYSALIAAAVMFATPAFALSPQLAAKKELEGWGRAALKYERHCHAGKLRQQMPARDAVKAYECFAEIIDKEVDLQYPDLYATLNEKMKAAHEAYAKSQPWNETLNQLRAASDEYNAAVAKRNSQGSAND